MSLHEQVLEAAYAMSGTTIGITHAMIGAGVPTFDRMRFYETFELDTLYADPELWASVSATRQWRITALCFMAAMVDSNDWKNL